MIKRFYQYAFMSKEFFTKGYIVPTQGYYESEQHFRDAQKIDPIFPVVKTNYYVDFPIPNEEQLNKIALICEQRIIDSVQRKKENKTRLQIVEEKLKELEK